MNLLLDINIVIDICVMRDPFAEVSARMIPQHLLKAMEYLGYQEGDIPVAEAVASNIFALPMHPYLEEAEIRKIADIVNQV